MQQSVLNRRFDTVFCIGRGMEFSKERRGGAVRRQLIARRALRDRRQMDLFSKSLEPRLIVRRRRDERRKDSRRKSDRQDNT